MNDDLQTVADAFTAAASRSPLQECVRVPKRPERNYHPAGLSLTYADVQELSEGLRIRYARAGYGHGHRVALLLENRPEFFVHWLTLNSLGVSVVPLNPDYRVREIQFALEESDAVLAVTLPDRKADCLAAAAGTRRSAPVVAIDEFAGPLPRAATRIVDAEPGRETEAALLFTSGTTGLPKGCMLDNEAFLFNGERYVTAGGAVAMRYGEERLFNPLPIYYANALAISNVAMLLSGGCIIIPDRFHPRSFWTEVVETEATILHHLGLIPTVLLDQDPAPDESSHHIKFSGGAGVDPSRRADLEERFGFPFVEFYGMTEVGVCAADNIEPRKTGTRSVGTPWSGVEFRLVGENDEDVAVGSIGELLIRRVGDDPRRGLCRGYLNDEDATRRAWMGGWFHTGDLMRRDADDCYYFVDRKKHMIRRSGQNISPAEVEAVVGMYPGVEAAVALPVPDEIRQEEVLACVVLSAGERADRCTADEIMDWCLEHLAYFKAPGWLLFLDALPTTSTHKIQKNAIFGSDEDPRSRPGMMDLRSRKKRLV